jgi:hypothetical protein
VTSMSPRSLVELLLKVLAKVTSMSKPLAKVLVKVILCHQGQWRSPSPKCWRR